MVMRLFSPAPRLCVASLLTESAKRAVNEARLPAAARNQRGPALSAREASTSPDTKSTALNPLMTFSNHLSLSVIPVPMLALASDNAAGRGKACPGGSAQGGTA